MNDSEKLLLDAIRLNGLFDAEWYLFANPDVRTAGIDPHRHFAQTGLRESRDFTPLFSSRFYLENNPDLTRANVHPFKHYVQFGEQELRQPHPYVDLRWVTTELGGDASNGRLILGRLASQSQIGPRPIFDLDLVRSGLSLSQETSVGATMAAFQMAAPDARPDPHILFSNDYVRRQIGFGTSLDPVAAYLLSDRAIAPHPLFDNDLVATQLSAAGHQRLSLLERLLLATQRRDLTSSLLFDPAFYSQQAGALLSQDAMPLIHYLSEGWRSGIDPNAYFDAKLYASRYLSGRQDVEPLSHYAVHGREPHVTLSPRFPDKLYISRNPDVVKDYKRTPLEHYLGWGRLEGRSIAGQCWKDDFWSWEEVAQEVEAAFGDSETGDPEVSVIIPVFDQFHYTLRSIWSIIRARDTARLQVIVADDGSSDETEPFFSALPGITYIRNAANLGFLRSCNNAATYATAPFLFFLNNDTAVRPGWIDILLETARDNPDAGMVGSKLIYPDGVLQEAGGFIWSDAGGANRGRYSDPLDPGYNFLGDVDYISGAAILIPRFLWEELGGFDERYAPAYCEDADLALALRQRGWRVLYQPASEIYHFEGVSSGTSLEHGVKAYQVVNQKKMREKWSFALERHFPNQHIDPRRALRPPRPRILVIDALVPQPDKDAGSLLAMWILRLLLKLGYHLTFIPCSLRVMDKNGQAMNALGIEVLHQPYVTSIDDYLDTHAAEFDAFLLFRYGEGGRYAAKLRQIAPDKPIILHTQDLHHLRARREAIHLGRDPEAMAAADKVRVDELRAIDTASETILVSMAELDQLHKEGNRSSFTILPLVIEPRDKTPPRGGREGVAFVGGYQHTPNVDAIVYFVTEIWPLVRTKAPGLKLHIAGSNPPVEVEQLAAEDIIVHGYVKDLDAFLDARLLTVAPLRYGAGIKGKIGSSLAAGVPCVSTKLGVEGMGLVKRQDVMVADEPQKFADAVVRVATDPKLWSTLSGNGQKFVRENYAPDVIRMKLLRLLAKVSAAPFAGTSPLTGRQETRRFLGSREPDSLTADERSATSSERVLAAAFARGHGATSATLLELDAEKLNPVALFGDLRALDAQLARVGVIIDPEKATWCLAKVTLDQSAERQASALLASLNPDCARLAIACDSLGEVGFVRPEPAKISAIVNCLERAGWDVRTDRDSLPECFLTSVVLIEARKNTVM